MSAVPPPPPSTPGSFPATGEPRDERKPLWKRWWVIAIAVVVLVGAIGAITGGNAAEDDADAGVAEPSTSAQPSEPSTEPASTPAQPELTTESTATPAEAAPASSAAAATGEPETDESVIGSTIETGSGGVARVNAVTPNVAPRDDFFVPEPGFTFTDAEVEICAGEDGQAANALYWKAFLPDNTEAEVSLGSDLQTVGLATGGCTRGWVTFSVPEGAAVTDIVLTDPLFREIARWSTASSIPVAAPLEPAHGIEAVAVAAPVELDDAARAVVRSVTTNAVPDNEFMSVAPGHQLVEIDVELCAGSEPFTVNPLYWVVTAQDHYTGGATLGGGTLGALELAAGQCAAGTVQLDVLEQSAPAYVVLTDPIFDEWARWAI